jgi:hypothetical protein
MILRILSLVITAAWAASLLHGGETWPQWRGPTRDGQFSGPAWPDSLEEARLVQRWRFPQGPGYSGPIVTADTVFTTETVAKKSERVTALDRSTGKPRWTRDWEGSLSVPFFAKSNGDWIVGLFNREDTPQTRTLSLAQLGLSSARVRDLWQHADLGTMATLSFEIPAHGCRVFRMVPGATSLPGPSALRLANLVVDIAQAIVDPRIALR